MTQKTFTEKLIDLVITGDMPEAKGDAATESGLIIATSKMTAPICASYGSAVELVKTIAAVIEQNEPIRYVLLAGVYAYVAAHPDDPAVVDLKKFIE